MQSCLCLRHTKRLLENNYMRLMTSSIEKPGEKGYTDFKDNILRELDRAKRCVLFAYNIKGQVKVNEERCIHILKDTEAYNNVIENLHKTHGDVKSINQLSEGLFCIEFQRQEIPLRCKIVAVKNFTPKKKQLDQPKQIDGDTTQQLENLYQHVKLTKKSYQATYFTAEFIRSFINMTDQSAFVLPFGSALSGHGIKGGSDLDLVWLNEKSALHPDISYRDDLLKLGKSMRKANKLFMRMYPILNARVPIITFNFRITGDSVDLSRGLITGPLMGETLVWLNEHDDRFSKLVLVIKLLAKSRGVVKSGCSHISSNTLTMLIIAFLQSKKILPPLNDAYSYEGMTEVSWRDIYLNVPRPKPTVLRDSTSLGVLFQEFFAFCLETDFRKVTVDVYRGEIYPRQCSSNNILSVLNPFDLNHNVAMNVTKSSLSLFTDLCSDTLTKVITTSPRQFNSIWFEKKV